jgi:hypothetical protein
MCLSCHLPIKDVAANQVAAAGSPPIRRRRLGRRITGFFVYVAAVAWCWFQLPTSMLFVAPAAVAGAWLHAGKGRPWLGLLVFIVIVAVLPMLFWPSMLTGLFSDLTANP